MTTTRNNFTAKQMKAMRERSHDVCEAGKFGTFKMYGMADADSCHRQACEFDHIVADALKRTVIKSIDEGLHICKIHHKIKTTKHDYPKIAKAKRISAHNAGVKRQKAIWPSRKFGLEYQSNVKQIHEDF